MKYREKAAVNKEGKQVIWKHPGGKLRRLGPTSLTDTELLTVIIGSGISGRSAEDIATEIIGKYYLITFKTSKTHFTFRTSWIIPE